MADVVRVASTLIQIISKIVHQCEQRGENAQVLEELCSFLQSLESFLQETQEKALTLHNNSATWALESVQEDLKNAILDAENILKKGFVRSVWDAKKIRSRVEALRNRVTTSFQTRLPVAILDVAIEGKQAQVAFQAAMVEVNKELQKSSSQEQHLALRKVLRQALQPITLALESHSHKIEAAVSMIHSSKPQTSDAEKFFEDVLAALNGSSVYKNQGEGDSASSSDNTKRRSGGPVEWYKDPITWETMCDPVKATDGHTYDRWTILRGCCSIMATSPFQPSDPLPFHIAVDDIDVRSSLFLQFPEQESQFRAKRAEYRDDALREAQLEHFADAASMLGHVLQWSPHDVECSEKLQFVQRRMRAEKGKSIPSSDDTHLLGGEVDQSQQDAVQPQHLYPSRLDNARSNGDRLLLSPDGLSCSFAAGVESDSVGAAIGDMAVPVRDELQRSTTVFYFEISIEKLDGNNIVGLGFTRSQSFHDNLLPGCYPNSCGYRGDRGCIFADNRLVQQGGRTARQGDTMGAGIHHGHKEIFFVHNGTLIAVMANTLSGTVMPVVALGTPCAYIKVAFNGSAFHPEPKPSRLVMSDLNSQQSIVSLSSNGLTARYIGGPQCPELSLQADYGACFRHPSQIYYFELTVINKHVAIGFVNRKFFKANNQLPGWYLHSCGYHGDDGQLFFGRSQGSKFGPTFSTGDTIGAGIDRASGAIFFIKNGKKVGHTCMLSMSCDLYPVIGLNTPDQAVSLNFGQAPFSFDTSIIPNLDAEERLTRLSVPSRSISKSVSLSRDGLTAHYVERQSAVASQLQPAAALLADRAIYTFRRVYYFELTVLNGGASSMVGIGFCNQGDFDCHKMPGWYANSYGYHGDDGNLFIGHGVGKKFGQTFSTGDDVGAGVDYSNNTIFFTKNGSLVGCTMEMNVSSALCAVIGLRTPNAKVHLNFGRDRFSFDTSQI